MKPTVLNRAVAIIAAWPMAKWAIRVAGEAGIR